MVLAVTGFSAAGDSPTNRRSEIRQADTVEAGGVETNSRTENAQLIDFSRRTKRQKLEKRGQLERVWNTA